MQILTVNVQDSFMQSFLKFINSNQENITIAKKLDLELDPYFYERQKELQEIRDKIKSGKMQMVSHDEVWNNIKQHLATIK